MLVKSDILTVAPEKYESEVQRAVYEALGKLEIAFERVDTDELVTMEDCLAVDEKLCMKTVKTLFLCNRQQTDFYIFVTPGDKPFRTKDFSSAMGISRVSFAPAEILFEMLGCKVGGTSVLSCINDKEGRVKVVFDKEVLSDEYYGCNDGTTTCYMKMKTEDVFKKYLSYIAHEPTVIEV
jgi:Ala-tRNA(Pro) deacylase